MNDFLTKNDVEIYAKEYLAELRDIAQHYISLIIEHDDDKHFINSIFEKVKCCTNPSRKVVLLADENVSLDNFARAVLQDKAIVIYFNPKLFDTFNNLKLMFDLAEQFIWHEATHLARMDVLGTDESHESDISDDKYLGSNAELNAFAIQSLSTTDDKDLAMDIYECCASDEVYDKFIKLRDALANNRNIITESYEQGKCPVCGEKIYSSDDVFLNEDGVWCHSYCVGTYNDDGKFVFNNAKAKQINYNHLKKYHSPKELEEMFESITK